MAVFDSPDFNQHENVVFGQDEASGLKAIIAVHSTQLGPSLGGCRMYPYANDELALRDALRLSRGMTYKSALAGLPLGGGKCVIIGDPQAHKSEALFKAMGRLVERLSGAYIAAQDSGIAVEDLAVMASQTRHVVGHQTIADGTGTRSGDPSPATAYGVFAGLKMAVKHRLGQGSLSGLKVAIQGLGNVGFSLAQYLKAEGAQLLVSDINPHSVARAVNELGALAVSNDEIMSQDADVYSPCALGGAINDGTIHCINAPVIAGCANNQLERPEHGQILHDKGILYAPDYAISGGGIIHVHYVRTQRTWQDVLAHVDNIALTLDEIFVRSKEHNKATSEIAFDLACERIAAKEAVALVSLV